MNVIAPPRLPSVLALLILVAPPAVSLATAAKVENLAAVQEAYAALDGRPLVVIRRFAREGRPQALVVRADTLLTEVITSETLSSWEKKPPGFIPLTRYGKLLNRYCAEPFPVQNDGLTRAETPLPGWFLTVDMCQSKVRFEQEFFERVAALGTKKVPVPLALCMTGRWMSERPEEFAWLRDQAARGRLGVTWVNHSWSHPYNSKLPLEKNFLLQAGVDAEEEILRTEQFLLEHDLPPSVFFRFPGLVSDARLVNLVRTFGLIPLGADAWLNKGEIAKHGSIILVHGNGNEHPGIVKFYQLVDNATAPGRPETARPLPFLPLTDSLPSSP